MIKLPIGDFFSAKDSNGKEYLIHAVATFEDGTKRVGLAQPLAPAWLETSEGQTVEYIDKGRYRIIDLNIELTSDDPKAYRPL